MMSTVISALSPKKKCRENLKGLTEHAVTHFHVYQLVGVLRDYEKVSYCGSIIIQNVPAV